MQTLIVFREKMAKIIALKSRGRLKVEFVK